MDPILIEDPISKIIGGAGGVTGLILLIRTYLKWYKSDRKDNVIDQAEESLFTNLRLENARMASQMTSMSLQLDKLTAENHELNKKITDLTISVLMLRNFEDMNVTLQVEIVKKDSQLDEANETIKQLRVELGMKL